MNEDSISPQRSVPAWALFSRLTDRSRRVVIDPSSIRESDDRAAAGFLYRCRKHSQYKDAGKGG